MQRHASDAHRIVQILVGVTVQLRKVLCGFVAKVHEMDARVGTELEIVQEGLPSAIPLEFCYLGWQESLSLLAHVVEPEIPDGVAEQKQVHAARGHAGELLHRVAQRRAHARAALGLDAAEAPLDGGGEGLGERLPPVHLDAFAAVTGKPVDGVGVADLLQRP